MSAVPSAVGATPLFIGAANAEAIVGRDWRWCRETAQLLGVPIVRARRGWLIPADLFAAALLATTSGDAAELNAPELKQQPASTDDILAALGKKRVNA